MKKIPFIVCFLATILMSCNEEKWIDVTVMPEETATGANTFGCLVDGWIYVGGRYTDNYGTFNSQPSINFIENKAKTHIDVSVKVRRYEYITFTINNPMEGQECTFTNAKYETKDENNASNARDLGSGKVTVTRFDGTVISGRFEGGSISHGQFDVLYKIGN